MADTAINNGKLVSFRNGGVLRITDDTTDYAVNLIENGTLTITPGRHEVVEYDNQGVLEDPAVSVPGWTEISLTAKLVNGATTAASLYNVLNQQPTAGRPHNFAAVEVDLPDHARATVGENHAFANCYVSALSMQSGENYDTIQVTFRSRTSYPTVGEFGGV